jgi:Arc/MetJ-type ribon-helix-helix transcriptional regulator
MSKNQFPDGYKSKAKGMSIVLPEPYIDFLAVLVNLKIYKNRSDAIRSMVLEGIRKDVMVLQLFLKYDELEDIPEIINKYVNLRKRQENNKRKMENETDMRKLSAKKLSDEKIKEIKRLLEID